MATAVAPVDKACRVVGGDRLKLISFYFFFVCFIFTITVSPGRGRFSRAVMKVIALQFVVRRPGVTTAVFGFRRTKRTPQTLRI